MHLEWKQLGYLARKGVSLCVLDVQESETDHKWKQLGDLAITSAKFPLASECLKKAKDFPSLLLLYSSTGNKEGIRQLARSVLFLVLILLYTSTRNEQGTRHLAKYVCFLSLLLHAPTRGKEGFRVLVKYVSGPLLDIQAYDFQLRAGESVCASTEIKEAIRQFVKYVLHSPRNTDTRI